MDEEINLQFISLVNVMSGMEILAIHCISLHFPVSARETELDMAEACF